jgi:hypothetical protein
LAVDYNCEKGRVFLTVNCTKDDSGHRSNCKLTVDHNCKRGKREGLLSLLFAETVFSVMCQVQHRRHCLQTISDISKQGWLTSSFRELSNVAFSDHSITCQHSESYNKVALTLETYTQRAVRRYNTDVVF